MNYNERPQKFLKWTICLFFSGCWQCDAIGRSQNASPFLHHKENALCYGNSYKKCASLSHQCFFFTHASFHAV